MNYVKGDYSLTIQNCWFETGAGSGVGWNSPYNIVTRGIRPEYPGNVIVRDCMLVSGTAGMTDKNPEIIYSFWKCESGQNHIIENLIIDGNRIDCIVNIKVGLNKKFQIRDVKQINEANWGYIARFNKLQTGCIEQDTFRQITYGETTPSGGYNGDIYIQYT